MNFPTDNHRGLQRFFLYRTHTHTHSLISPKSKVPLQPHHCSALWPENRRACTAPSPNQERPPLKRLSTHHRPLGYVISGEGKWKQMNVRQLGRQPGKDAGPFPPGHRKGRELSCILKLQGVRRHSCLPGQPRSEFLPIKYFLSSSATSLGKGLEFQMHKTGGMARAQSAPLFPGTRRGSRNSTSTVSTGGIAWGLGNLLCLLRASREHPRASSLPSITLSVEQSEALRAREGCSVDRWPQPSQDS